MEHKCPNKDCKTNATEKPAPRRWKTKVKGTEYECRVCGQVVTYE